MIIYEPKGRAYEYAKLAANIYRGCSHGCSYCYAPACLFMKKQDFFCDPKPRAAVLSKIKKEIPKFSGNEDKILISFTSDPYQPIEAELRIVRQVLLEMKKYDVAFSILTKGGMRAARDFDIMADSRCEFGTTMTFFDDVKRSSWEPGAACVDSRIESMRQAHNNGIPTFVSLEPVIEPAETLKIIKKCHSFVDFWKIGKLNYNKIAKEIDWRKFLTDVENLLKSIGANWLIKKDLEIYRHGEKIQTHP